MAQAAVLSKAVVQLLLIYCFMYLPLFVGVRVGLCFGIHHFMSFLVLQSSWRGRESWLLCFYCILDFLILQMSCSSSSRCCGLVYSMWSWYSLIILTYFLYYDLTVVCLHTPWNKCICGQRGNGGGSVVVEWLFYVLSCQPRVTVTSCFVHKVIRDLESIDHLCIILSKGFALAQVECTS